MSIRYRSETEDFRKARKCLLEDCASVLQTLKNINITRDDVAEHPDFIPVLKLVETLDVDKQTIIDAYLK